MDRISSRPAAARTAVGRGLHGRVLLDLGTQIVDGVIPVAGVIDPGAASVEFGVSRSVIREALRVLESLGMVRPRQGVGTQVLPRESWNLLHPYVIAWRGHGREYFQQMHELLELRWGIEPVAARLAAERMTPAETAGLVAIADRLRITTERGDDDGFLSADVEFHSVILRGSGNHVFANFADTVAALLRTRQSEPRFAVSEYTPASAHRHSELAAAIAAADPDGAQRWAWELIAQTVVEFRREDPESAPA
ncbi:FCD domain-containing protein [Galbitalea sp. SE-J8]|uniref:FadR/GntR family transcriptional regulator n=1 Tax=Galbitalea sp. SE-J8 TaxID=3054952 RepID=UPI00259D0E55|nr:FCD domain-containing protein [Galbitalea sp. SE-J8]MDM4762424.1 FCD domain-containing protein [Galbitalea sp. SE-J8]